MSDLISIRINCSSIDKARLYPGKNGKYLDLVLMKKREVDQYGNDWMCVQSVTKEERQAGVKGAILGNGKTLGQVKQAAAPSTTQSKSTDTEEDDVPF